MDERTGTLDPLFAGRQEAHVLFSAVRTSIELAGPVRMEAMKTTGLLRGEDEVCMGLASRLWIRKQPEDSIVLPAALRRCLDDPRITGVVESRPGRFTYHVVIRNRAEMDDQIRIWIREAYGEDR